MTNICAACCKKITTKQHLECSKCGENYHTICINISDFRKLSDSFKLNWMCPSCQSKEPKKGNAGTPVRSSAAVEGTDNRKATTPIPPQTDPPMSPDNESIGTLAAEIRLLRNDMCEVKDHLSKLMSSLVVCFSRLDTLEANLTVTDARLKALEDHELEKALLVQQVCQLQETVNSQAQASLRNDIEIQGLNEAPNENTHHIILTAAAKIGVSLKDEDLDFVSRVGPPLSRGKDQIKKTPGSRSRILVVRFLRQHKRDEFLKAAKARRNLTSAVLGVGGPASNIFCNERLTKVNRELFRGARLRKSSAGYKYCWTRNGTVLVRKCEGSQAIAIRNHADLLKCFGPESAVLEPAFSLDSNPTSVAGFGAPGQSPVAPNTDNA
ncbi:uncharacterized protein [Choristoneura fumiferana]|uniref:uncharacterized protein n=1 Tax=Choristoneura fumiferana TaxID=7141 RepID=UPI003D15BE5D